MTYIVGALSQKGGVGKSTIARLIAREAANAGLKVKIADLDTQQTTSVKWAARRAERDMKPAIRVEAFASVKDALADAENFDLYVFDGAPHSSRQTLEIARAADLSILPTSEGIDDLEPAVILAHELRAEGVPIEKIRFAFCKTADSERELQSAREYLSKTPYTALEGEIPFRAGFKIALDKGNAITETTFRTLAKRADGMAQNIIDAVAAAAEGKAA